MSELDLAVAHDGAPCRRCKRELLTDSTCQAIACDVLGCRQPKDPRFTSTHPAVGTWTWCVTHGELYKERDRLGKIAADKLDKAEREGRVIRG